MVSRRIGKPKSVPPPYGGQAEGGPYNGKNKHKREAGGLDARGEWEDNTGWSGTSRQVRTRTPFEP